MQRQQRKYFLSFLLAASLLLQVLLPFFATYQPSATAANSSVFGEKVLLCTGEGFRWVAWEDLQSGKELPRSHTKYKCPLCYLAGHNTFLGGKQPAFAAGNTTAAIGGGTAFSPASITPGDLLWSRLHTRAPPASFV